VCFASPSRNGFALSGSGEYVVGIASGKGIDAADGPSDRLKRPTSVVRLQEPGALHRGLSARETGHVRQCAAVASRAADAETPVRRPSSAVERASFVLSPLEEDQVRGLLGAAAVEQIAGEMEIE
jgi:hypothetical protein